MKSKSLSTVLYIAAVGSVLFISRAEAESRVRYTPLSDYKYKYIADDMKIEIYKEPNVARNAPVIKNGEVVESDFLRHLDKDHRAKYYSLDDAGKTLARRNGAQDLKESDEGEEPDFDHAVDATLWQIKDEKASAQNRMLHNGMDRLDQKKNSNRS